MRCCRAISRYAHLHLLPGATALLRFLVHHFCSAHATRSCQAARSHVKFDPSENWDSVRQPQWTWRPSFRVCRCICTWGDQQRALPWQFRHSALNSQRQTLNTNNRVQVGLDPRGVGLSNQVQCDPSIYADRVSLFPQAEEELVKLKDKNRRFGESCLNGTGRVFEHLDTIRSVMHYVQTLKWRLTRS